MGNLIMANGIINRDMLRKKMRQKKDIQKDTADFLGISRQYFHMKLSGKKDFTETEIFLLVKRYGVAILFLDVIGEKWQQ